MKIQKMGLALIIMAISASVSAATEEKLTSGDCNKLSPLNPSTYSWDLRTGSVTGCTSGYMDNNETMACSAGLVEWSGGSFNINITEASSSGINQVFYKSKTTIKEAITEINSNDFRKAYDTCVKKIKDHKK